MTCKFMDRRSFLKKSLLASAGAGVALSLEEKNLLAKESANLPQETDNNLQIPKGKIKEVEISRLICGGNLIAGYAHSRDLIYVSELLRNYFTPERIMETWEKCEQRGINTMVANIRNQTIDQKVIDVLKRYWNERGGEIQWIAQCNPQSDDLTTNINQAVDNGAVAAFIQGGVGDRWTKHKRVDLLGKVVNHIKSQGIIAGVAGHSLQVTMECEKEGVDVDFYVKTFHHDKYWSATPKEYRKDFIVDIERFEDHNLDHDNMWCINPEEVMTFMKQINKPWMAYKVLAAGAIDPKTAFNFAYKNGADFIIAGMFDFQVVEDSILARQAYNENINRLRKWMG
jgi:hypothetical protein